MAKEKVTIDIDIALKNADAAKTLDEVKKSIKELTDMQVRYGAGSSEFTKAATKAGELRNKINDAKDSLKNLSSSPVENISNSFRNLRGQLASLDFGGAKQSLKDLGGSTATFTKSLLGIKEGATVASVGMRGLGAAIAATGIGLIVIAISTLISKFDEIKTSGGAVGKVFTYIGDTIKVVQDKMLTMLDYFGLVDKAAIDSAAAQEKATNQKAALWEYEKSKYSEVTQKKIQANIDHEKNVKGINEKLKKGDIDRKEANEQTVASRLDANRKIIAADEDRAKKNKEIADKEAKARKEAADKIAADKIAAQKKELEHRKEIQAEIEKLAQDFLKTQEDLNAKSIENGSKLADILAQQALLEGGTLAAYNKTRLQIIRDTFDAEQKLRNEQLQAELDRLPKVLSVEKIIADAALKDAIARTKFNNEQIFPLVLDFEKNLTKLKEDENIRRRKLSGETHVDEKIALQDQLKALENSYTSAAEALNVKVVDKFQKIKDAQETILFQGSKAYEELIQEGQDLTRDSLELQKKFNEAKAVIDAKAIEVEITAQKEANKKKKDERLKDFQDAIQLAQTLNQTLSTINDIVNQEEQRKQKQRELDNKTYFETLVNQREQAYSKETNALNTKYQKEFNAAKGNATKQKQITDKYNADVKKSEKEKTDYINKQNFLKAQKEYELAEQRNDIAEKEFKRNKAFQIAGAIINTAAGVTGALAHSGDQTPPLAIAQSIAIGIAGAAQIAKIAATKFSPTDIGQPPVAPIIEADISGAEGSSSTLEEKINKPSEFNTEFITTGRMKGEQLIKVYVLESEISNVQNAVKTQVLNNTWG